MGSSEVSILAHNVLSIFLNTHLCLFFCFPYNFASIQKYKVNLLDWQGLKLYVIAKESMLTEFVLRSTGRTFLWLTLKNES